MEGDHDLFDTDGSLANEPPPNRAIKESVVAIVIALAVGAALVLLLQIHYIASLIGAFTWIAATMVPGIFAANYVYKLMAGFHGWARLTVGLIVFFSACLLIVATLRAYHF